MRKKNSSTQGSTTDPSSQLETVVYLRKFIENRKNGQQEALKQLQKTYGIKCKRHTQHPNLILLKYDMLKSPMNNKMVQECRGLILDENNFYKVIVLPYTKFFNLGEPNSAVALKQLDFDTASVYDKLDGSLCTIYYYEKKWHVSSSGVPDASAHLTSFAQPTESHKIAEHQIEDKIKTSKGYVFSELFWDIWNKLNYQLPVDTTLCYMFEMVTPRHIILCQPKKEEIILHGVRDMKTLKELRPQEIAKQNGWECIKSYDMFKSLKDVVQSTREMNPIANEGYIVCDANFNRVKIKSPQYVALSHLSSRDKNGVNARMMLDVIRTNEGSEFLSYFGEYKSLYERVKKQSEDFMVVVKEWIHTVHEKYKKETISEEVVHQWLTTQAKELTAQYPPRSKGKQVREFMVDLFREQVVRGHGNDKGLLEFLSQCDIFAFYETILMINNISEEEEKKTMVEEIPKEVPKVTKSNKVEPVEKTKNKRGKRRNDSSDDEETVENSTMKPKGKKR